MPGIDEVASIIFYYFCVYILLNEGFLRIFKKNNYKHISFFFANDSSTLMTLLPYVMKQFCIKMDDVSKYVIFI